MPQSFKELRSLFLRNALAFGIIFFMLGLLVNQVLNISLYQNVDQELNHLLEDPDFLERELNHLTFKKDNLLENNQNADQNNNQQEPPIKMKPNSFMTQTILWSKDGDILNAEGLGDRIYDFTDLTLEKDKTGIRSLQVKDSFGTNLNFRSITKEVDEGEVAYVQVLSNTNQTESSLLFFRTVLIISMIIFWIISLFVSYYLAKRNLRPILVSWKKQQEFVENSSHELRTPLTIIQAKLEKLFTKPNNKIIDESEDIALALNEVRRLSQLTSDLLLLARSDSNELTLNRQTINSHDFLNTLIQPYQEIAQSHNKMLIFEEEGAHEIGIDRKLMTQVLIILIDNGLKYTPENGTVTITSSFTDKYWQINVKDNGIGLATQNKQLLFERFYREDKARQRSTGGHGLGLSIAKGIIDLHQGKISADDNNPQGADFKILLPK